MLPLSPPAAFARIHSCLHSPEECSRSAVWMQDVSDFDSEVGANIGNGGDEVQRCWISWWLLPANGYQRVTVREALNA